MKEEKPDYRIYGIDFGTNAEERELIRAIREEPERTPVVFCRGVAGTGKTFTALAASLDLVRARGAKKKYKNIFYVREPVEIGHRLGYLKGTEEDKYGPYLGPLLDNYNHLMKAARDNGMTIQVPKAKRKARNADEEENPVYSHLPSDIISLAPEFLRGRSFEDCIILVDEAQNLTLDELQTLATRIGRFTKMIILGSPNQIDIPGQSEEKNDFLTAYEILKPTGLVRMVELKTPMRSDFVADFDCRFSEYKASLSKKLNH